MAGQNYFTHFEPSQSLGGAKTGYPREKPPDHPQAELGLSHMWPELGSNPQRWDDERFRALKISGLNHSATGADNSLELFKVSVSQTVALLNVHKGMYIYNRQQ